MARLPFVRQRSRLRAADRLYDWDTSCSSFYTPAGSRDVIKVTTRLRLRKAVGSTEKSKTRRSVSAGLIERAL